jgi:hypothetical protein
MLSVRSLYTLTCNYQQKQNTASDLRQVCKYPGHEIAQGTKFYAVTPNICGPSVWYLVLAWFHLAGA